MSLIEQARAWIAIDPDPDTRDELRTLIDSGDQTALAARFSGTLEFGTAGLRGQLGAGPTRMNRVTVALATAGLCAWLAERVPGARRRGICVGRDAREKSEELEREVVEVATAAGFRVLRFTDVVPTPVVAFSVLHEEAAAGVVVTASHNPPGYNGFKVYWENGAQVVPPNDQGIAERVKRASRTNVARLSVERARASNLVVEIDAVREVYVERIVRDLGELGDPARAALRIAYTALHGVAEAPMRRSFERAGFIDVASVESQATPDGSFPTVAFPNPEEPRAMDRVLALGEQRGADLAIANDPDGDRVAVAARGREGLEVLSGDEIGLLLADELLRRHRGHPRPLVLSSVVSSPALGPIAAKHGARWEQTLPGHKWIQNRAIDLTAEGYACVFGYEEALGFACSPAVRDKDGISAALLLADIAARAKAEGDTLVDRRRALWKRHGVFLDRQVSLRFEGDQANQRIEAIMKRLRDETPWRIGALAVIRRWDLDRQTVWVPDGPESGSRALPRGNVLAFSLEDGSQVLVRPSGTEPKLKYYLHARRGIGPEGLDAARAEAAAVLTHLAEAVTGTNGAAC